MLSSPEDWYYGLYRLVDSGHQELEDRRVSQGPDRGRCDGPDVKQTPAHRHRQTLYRPDLSKLRQLMINVKNVETGKYSFVIN